MSRVVIEKKICLEPQYLNERLLDYLRERLQKEVLNRSDQVYGYITKIYDKIEVVENSISSAGTGVFFTVRFTAKAFRPAIGNVYKGKLCMTFPQGIFVEIMEKIKVLIPEANMGLFKYNKTTSSFKNGSVSLKQGDVLSVQLSLVKYERHNFNCIGNLKSIEKE